ncbi:MAG: STAS/SEC14 domain-containing protein [Pseudomonadales bacterium]
MDERISVAALHEALHSVVPQDDDGAIYVIVSTGFGRVRGTRDEVTEAAKHHRNDSDDFKLRAAVVVGDDLSFGIVRMLASQVEDLEYELRPFHEDEEATSWLNECMDRALRC